MRIVLSGALPNAAQARELIPHVEQQAPALVNWLRAAKAVTTLAEPAHTGTTAFEYWHLASLGFKPADGQNFATGLPLILPQTVSPPDASQPIWLVELVHVAPARDGAALLPASILDITPEESEALLESSAPLFEEHGFTVRSAGTQHWSVTLPEGCLPVNVSPLLVSRTSVNTWWSQAPESRAWRKLVNTLQMFWFDHPVNQRRALQQRLPINSAWLFGGCLPGQIQRRTLEKTEILDQLDDPTARQDWALWLDTLKALDFRFSASVREIVFTGEDRIISVRPHTVERLKKMLGVNKNSWRHWWSTQH